MMKAWILAAALLGSLGASADIFEYVNPIDPTASLTIDTFPPSVAVRDIAHAARFCDQLSTFICVESDIFNFAVPMKIDAATRQWEHGGRSYSIVDRTSVALFGIVEQGVLRIHSVDGDHKLAFLYSPTNGLLGVQVGSGEGARVFLSKGRKGYGAVRSTR